MSIQLNTVNTASDTWVSFISKFNDVVLSVNTSVLTSNASVSGSLTVGNTYLHGIFSSNVLTANGVLRGGNVSTSNTLYVGSNVNVNNYSLSVSNSVSTLLLTPTIFSVGNSTVNTSITSNNITTNDLDSAVANIVSAAIEILSINTASVNNSLTIGNTVSNTSISMSLFKSGNSTVNVSINSTSLIFANSSGSFAAMLGSAAAGSSFDNKFKFANTTTTGTSSQVIDSFLKSDFRSVEYFISVKNNVANGFMSSKLLCMHDGNVAYQTDYGVMVSNSSLASYTISTNTTHVILSCTPTPTNTAISYVRTNIGV